MPSSAPPPRPKQSPAAAAPPPPPPAVLRDKKKKTQQHQEPRYLDLNPESSNRDSSSSASSSSLVSPYHVTEVTGGHLPQSPERVWLESLRQGGVPVPVPGSATSQGPSPGRVPKPTHSYTPLRAAEGSELKFAFDMELLKRTGEAVVGGEIDDVSEIPSIPFF